ncbi:MAG: hypothetical protein ACLF0P_14240 [Thermoanaerobaculia bacterium]
MSPGDSSGPSDGIDVQTLLESVMPELTAILARSPLTPERTDVLLDETVRSLLLQWPKIDDRRTWLLETLERAIGHEARHGPRPLPEEPEDEGSAEEPDDDVDREEDSQ